MSQLFTDLRSGVRMLVKYPTLSLVAILTLGLGIGLSTTVFCVVNGGLFKGLPFPNADRIVVARRARTRRRTSRGSRSACRTSRSGRQRQTSFEKFGAFGFAPMNLSHRGRTAGAFQRRPADGRRFRGARRAAAPRPRIPRRATIGPAPNRSCSSSYDLWRDRYGSSPDDRRHGRSAPTACRAPSSA